MTSKEVGIEEARKRLGDLVTSAQQGTDIILTRNRRPVARIARYQEDPVITIAELTAELNLPATATERVARFAGAFTTPDLRTGRIPKPWAGKGMGATFTRDEADDLIAEWHRIAAEYETQAAMGGSGPLVDPSLYERMPGSYM